MCGIIGLFNAKDENDALKLVKTGLKAMENRGKDGTGFESGKDFVLGHCLHSVVNFVKQPIKGNGIFISNCEIYNWKELNKKYKLNAKNDSEVLFKLLEKRIENDKNKSKDKRISENKNIEKTIKEILDEIDGVYAFAYKINNKIIIARDIIGVKPVWFSHTDTFAFASEKKALEKLKTINTLNASELNPRKILVYNTENNKINFIEREFFKISPEIKENRKNKQEIIKKLTKLLENSIKKRIPKTKFALLFSGGVDSTYIALILKKLGCNFTCYTAGIDSKTLNEAEDVVYAKKAAKKLNLKLKIIRIKEENVEKYVKKIVPLIEDSNVVKVGVALPFFAACEEAKKDGCKVIFSGLGSEEIFAGYQRHKNSLNINKECVSGLLKMYERDMYRDDVITMNNNLELRLPFLDKKLVDFALKIPANYKINGETSKIILREIAEKQGMPKEIAERKKRAAQYGSNCHKVLKKLAKKNNFKTISEYLLQFYPRRNLKLGALVSSGKDSIYAMHIMKKQNYEISCMITLKSTNPDSFMFHTPGIEMAELQAEACNIPIIVQETKGEKEKELKDLKNALEKAKSEYKIQGIITGALFSNYQRERIEKVADSVGLKIFSPLWHMNQETEMRQLLNEGFEVIITAIAADGLDESWLGRRIDEKMIDELVGLNKKFHLNVAGEGGEFESLVLNAPMFTKKIHITKAKKLVSTENSGRLIIQHAELR